MKNEFYRCEMGILMNISKNCKQFKRNLIL